MENNFNEKQSLELITRMIENTKSNLGKGAGNYFIAWGMATFLAAILVGVALYLTNNNPLSNWLWMFIPLYGLIYQSRFEKPERVITKVDKITLSVWKAITPVAIMLPLIFKLIHLYEPSFVYIFSLIPFIEILIVSIGIVITGAVISYRPLVIGGCVGVMMSFATLLLTVQYQTVLWFAIWALTAMVIPGIKLNKYAKKNAKNA